MSTELKIELGRDCVRVQPGYNGDRHHDKWVRHKLEFGIVAYTYPDGELIEVLVPATVRDLERFSYTGWLPSSFEKPVGFDHVWECVCGMWNSNGDKFCPSCQRPKKVRK